MVRILLNGANGKMGKVIANCVEARDDCEIVAGVDITNDGLAKFPIFNTFSDVNVDADVVIDFSHPNALNGILKYCLDKNLAVVVSTTGYNDDQISEIHKAAQKIPVLFSFNMSLGINLLVELAKKATEVLGEQFDIEIIEKHHNQKIDAPSGTAIMIEKAINETMDNKLMPVFDRHSQRKKREKNEIGIHAVRGGTIVGEHEVLFAGRDETLTISHSAASKDVFAVGSVKAAIFLKGKSPKLYTMGDVVL